jgi:hypothetical protein
MEVNVELAGFAMPSSSIMLVARRDRLLVGAVALVLRVGLGLVFFGSIDVTNSVVNSQRLFNSQEVHLPYFPIVPILIWLGGVLNVHTQLPVAFCFKLVPILFDVLLAMLLYDVQARRCPASSFRLALLYAISPIALLITSIHGQWDTICLFFLLLSLNLVDDPVQNRRTRLLAGGCFALSFLVKPLPAVCLPFLFPPLLPTEGRRSLLSQSLDTALGMATVVILSFVLFWLVGCNPFRLCLEIMRYADQGVQIFGLPFVLGYHEWFPLKYRFWILAVLCWLAVTYHRGKLGRFESILFCFSFPLGVAGIGPQNLLWPVPFLLLTGKLRLGALYNLVTIAFLLVYYMTPSASYIPYENMGAFAALRGFSWLMPPRSLGEGVPADLLPFLGNLVIPVCCLAMAARAIGLGIKPGDPANPRVGASRSPTPPYALYLTPIAGLAMSIALVYELEDRQALRAVSEPIVRAKLARYDMEISGSPEFGKGQLLIINGNPRMSYCKLTIVGDYPRRSYLNIASVLLVVALAWSVATLSLARHEPGDTTATPEELPGSSHSKYATGRTGQCSHLIGMR